MGAGEGGTGEQPSWRAGARAGPGATGGGGGGVGGGGRARGIAAWLRLQWRRLPWTKVGGAVAVIALSSWVQI